MIFFICGNSRTKNTGCLISEALRHVPVTSFRSKYWPARNAKAVFFITQYSRESLSICCSAEHVFAKSFPPKILQWEIVSLRPPFCSMQQRCLLFLLFALFTLPLTFYNYFLPFRRYMYAETTKTTRPKTSRDVVYTSASGGLRSLLSRDVASATTSGGLRSLPSRDVASASTSGGARVRC